MSRLISRVEFKEGNTWVQGENFWIGGEMLGNLRRERMRSLQALRHNATPRRNMNWLREICRIWRVADEGRRSDLMTSGTFLVSESAGLGASFETKHFPFLFYFLFSLTRFFLFPRRFEEGSF